MARWRLTDAHYLSVPGTEWEYKEADRETGRQARKVYEVPLHLDPKNRADQNYPDQDSIIVSSRYDPSYRRDIVFVGPPTPDMEPIDEEAKEISQGFIDRGAWQHPIDALNMTYSQSILSDFERQLANLLAGAQKQTPAVQAMSLGGVSQEAFEKLQAQVAQLMERNAQLEEAVVEKKTRRV